MNLGSLVSWSWRTHYKRSKAARSARSLLNSALEFFGDGADLTSIDRPALRRYIDHLRGLGDAEATVARKVKVVMKILRDASLEGWLATVPRCPDLPKQSRKRIRWFTEAEIQDILSHLSPEYQQFVTFLVNTGLRVSEAIGLSWQDVRGDVVDLWDTKGGGNRSVPLTWQAQDALTYRSRQDPGPWSTINYTAWIRAWNKARKALGQQDDKDWVPHTLRHTFASRLAQRGASLMEIQQLLGHKKMEMTLVYAHLAPSNLRNAVDLLEKVS